MVAWLLVLVFEVKTKSLVLGQDCIVDHMVLVLVHQEAHRIARVLDHHQIVDQVRKILNPIQVSLKICQMSDFIVDMMSGWCS